jgi:arginase
VAAARRAGELPIVLGGDHALTIGSFGGARLAAPDARLGIVWVDAHPDLNTPETTPSHHGHGMPLAALLGHGHPALVDAVRPGAKLAPADVVLFGTRAIDPGEARFLAERPELLVVPAAEVHDRGLASALERVLARIAELDAVHLSFDLDAVDSAAAPGVTTPVSQGLTPAEALELVSAIARSGKLVSADVVELTPERDPDGRTARLAADLVARIAAAEPEVAPVPAPDVLRLTADLA